MRSGLYKMEFEAGGKRIAKFNAVLLDGSIALFSNAANCRGTYLIDNDQLNIEIGIHKSTEVHANDEAFPLGPLGSTISCKGYPVRGDTAFEASGKLPGSGLAFTCCLILLDSLDPAPKAVG